MASIQIKDKKVPSIFESFNARSLNPEQVAKTFIPPDNFDRLAMRSHSLLVGPRGSGKTTLLKMLQVPALEAWQHPKAQYFREKIDFTGFFIQADKAWSEQIESIGNDELDKNTVKKLGICAFTTHIVASLIKVMEYRSNESNKDNKYHFRRVKLCREYEAELVMGLQDILELKIIVPSFQALKFAMTDRFSQIHKIAGELTSETPQKRKEILSKMGFMNLHFLHVCRSAIERFDTFTNSDDQKWAFLFDELEIVPQWIVQQLVGALRSTDEKFLFKLSLSPYSTVFNKYALRLKTIAAQKGHDFDEISLWYAYKNDAYEFCSDLFNGMLAEKGIYVKDPSRILHKSASDSSKKEMKDGTLYHKNSKFSKRMKSLLEKDPSFEVYLKKQEIDPDNIEEISGSKRAETLRKALQLILIRDAFTKVDRTKEGKSQLRSRKNPTIYSGSKDMFAIVEGNPRILIGLLFPLLSKMDKNKLNIKRWDQAKQIETTSERFKAMLATMPVPNLPKLTHTGGISAIIDAVGKSFQNRLLFSSFNPDLPLTFDIDKDFPDALKKSIGDAINAGAIIHVTDRMNAGIFDSFEGKRFRLSFLLAPLYNLPLIITGHDLSLRRIFAEYSHLSGFTEDIFSHQIKLQLDDK